MIGMDQGYRPWLPGEALDRAGVDRQLGELVGHWSAKWIAGPAWTANAAPPAGAEELSWAGTAEGLGLGIGGDARRLLAAAILGAPDQAFRSPTDLRFAESLADACLDDLRRRLAALFRLPPDGAWSEGWCDGAEDAGAHCLVVGPARRPQAVRLAVSRGLLVERVKAGLRNRPEPILLSSLARGLGSHVVDLGARVGACRLSLAELDGLGVGDVIVLDRPLDGPLELALDGSPLSLACVIDPGDGRLAIELAEPLFG